MGRTTKDSQARGMSGKSICGATFGGWTAYAPRLGMGNMEIAAVFVKYILICACINGTGLVLRKRTSSSERQQPPSKDRSSLIE